ncbi:recombinase family protein [Streptomyces sp. NPDC005402]|uniref:recombinase family protein n=1 Tax=Streptomyces sp. NPDC005402 TaxID=3155338 RepID=UPI0033B7BE02
MDTFGVTTDAEADSSWDGIVIPDRIRNRSSVALTIGESLKDFAPLRPGCYVRTSLDRHGEEKGVARQLEDAEAKRTRLHWGKFAEIYKENDTGAFKKRKVTKPDGTVDWMVIRPEFRRMLADLLSGHIDGVLFYDPDRLARQPRDLEDLIDVIEYRKRPAVGVTGDLNLISDSDRHMARMLCVMALKSSEDTARRVARNHLADAMNGEMTGRTGYAWTDEGKRRQGRARIAVRIFEQLLDGVSISGIARGLNKDKIPAPSGAKWTPATIKAILTNPRYCGFATYRGKHQAEQSRQRDGWGRVLVGDDGLPMLGKWDPVVSRQVWSDAQLELEHRRLLWGERGVRPNLGGVNTRKYVYTGYLRCGICKASMSAKFVSLRGHTIYYCPGKGRGACGKVSRRAAPIDELLEEFVIAWARAQAPEDPARLTSVPRQGNDRVQEIQAQAARINERKRALTSAWSKGAPEASGMRQEDYLQAVAGFNSALDTLERELEQAAAGAQSRRARDYETEWKNGGLEQKRTVLKDCFQAVYVMPSGKGRAPFDPEHITPVYVAVPE